MFFILGEPGYTGSNWYKHILDGIFAEKKSKRFSVVIIDSILETENFSVSCDDAIFLIGTNAGWLESVIDTCENIFGRNIIVLGNFERRLGGRSYSIVSTDISADVCSLYGYLMSYGKNKVAMYGINPKSASDMYRKNSFLECGGDVRGVYENNGNLDECFIGFEPYVHNYNAIICANDYCAVSLYRHLKERNINAPYIASCGETKLARFIPHSITNLKTSYKDFGKAAINVYKTLQKDFPVSSVKINLASCIVPGKSTDNLPVQTVPVFSPQGSESDDSFYRDSEVCQMLGIENVLSNCDKTETDMLFSLLDGMTYADIAEKYHMSVNGAKYRLNKLFALAGTDSKSDFIHLMKKYIN